MRNDVDTLVRAALRAPVPPVPLASIHARAVAPPQRARVPAAIALAMLLIAGLTAVMIDRAVVGAPVLSARGAPSPTPTES